MVDVAIIYEAQVVINKRKQNKIMKIIFECTLFGQNNESQMNSVAQNVVREFSILDKAVPHQ